MKASTSTSKSKPSTKPSSSLDKLYYPESLLSSSSSKKNDGDDYDPAGAYRDYYFICLQGPLMPRVEIPRWNTGAIEEHKETCPWCIEREKQRAEESRLRSEGPRRLQYILIVIGKAKDDIDYYERKKTEFELLEQKKREKGEEAVPDYWIEKEKLRFISYDAGIAKSTIEKERVELGKLLNHENEVIRNGAREEYLKYVDRMKKVREKYKNSSSNKKEIEIVTPA